MAIRNRKKEILDRLSGKSLDQEFVVEITQGLNCSPFEGEAVLEVVKEVFAPYLDQAGTRSPPGKATLLAVCADEPAGKPIAACQKRTVCLTLHRGAEDDRLMHEQGPRAFRRARIPELCQEALSQGGLLTCEDLAYRVFFVTTRTITRDLGALRRQQPSPVIPLRSTLHDMGPVLTHRTQIVGLALDGKTTTQICRILRHSPRAVANYLSTFIRVVQLKRRGLELAQIAFLLRRGRRLVAQYLELAETSAGDANRAYHLDELLRLGTQAAKKKAAPRRARHG